MKEKKLLMGRTISSESLTAFTTNECEYATSILNARCLAIWHPNKTQFQPCVCLKFLKFHKDGSVSAYCNYDTVGISNERSYHDKFRI